MPNPDRYGIIANFDILKEDYIPDEQRGHPILFLSRGKVGLGTVLIFFYNIGKL